MSDKIQKAAYAEKQIVIDEIKEKLSTAKSTVVIDYMGINVEQANALRKKLRDADVDYSVYKNTLVKRAIDGTDLEELSTVLEGPSAFAISYDDVTAPARVINEAMIEYKKMTFKAGIVEGTFLDAEGIKQIANIPSRETLVAKFMGSIQSPISALVRTLQAVADAEQDGSSTPVEEAAPVEEAVQVEETNTEE
ncbi:MAG: 50S ribosomal protein L10 [Anaerovoracaceae bacterium]